MKMPPLNLNEPIPMPPPVATTMMQLQSSNTSNTGHHDSQPGLNDLNPLHAGRLSESIQQPTSVINLSNSNDVVIGPMTQYQGAVTIYQYMDATAPRIEPRGKNKGFGIGGPPRDVKNCFAKFNTTQILISTLIILLIAVAISVAVNIILNKNSAKNAPASDKKKVIFFANEYEDETIPNLGRGHLVIDRKQWGTLDLSENIKLMKALQHPVNYVLVTHVGIQTTTCDNVYFCSIKMRILQDAAVAEKTFLDIQSNFYVTDDGYVYVGRGWNYANSYANSSISICFMGDYNRYKPTHKQLEGAQFLISYGISRSLIAPEYKLVALNQTRTTPAPGGNVYREIIKWPRWHPCNVNGNPPCEKELRGLENFIREE